MKGPRCIAADKCGKHANTKHTLKAVVSKIGRIRERWQVRALAVVAAYSGTFCEEVPCAAMRILRIFGRIGRESWKYHPKYRYLRTPKSVARLVARAAGGGCAGSFIVSKIARPSSRAIRACLSHPGGQQQQRRMATKIASS